MNLKIKKNPIINCGLSVGLFNEYDYRIWRVTLVGPKDSLYKGGLIFFNIEFPDDYPLIFYIK